MTDDGYNASLFRPQGGEALVLGSASRLTLASGAVVSTADGTGSAGHVSVTAAEFGCGSVHHTRVTLEDSPILMMVEAAIVGYGSLKLYDMPAGAIYMIGATANLTCARAGTDIAEAYDGDFSVGSTYADNDATLSTTEQNIIPTTATPQAVAGATTAKGQSTAVENAVINGTSVAVDVYLNFLIDIADITDNEPITVNGTVDMFWINLGDY